MRITRLVLAAAVVGVSLLSQLASDVASAEGCGFILGFNVLHSLIPDIVGNCTTSVRYDPPNQDGIQYTTNGMLVWRKADNFTAFTDGYRTWINGPYGIQQRLNTERFDWESNVASEQTPTPTSQIARVYSQREPDGSIKEVTQWVDGHYTWKTIKAPNPVAVSVPTIPPEECVSKSYVEKMTANINNLAAGKPFIPFTAEDFTCPADPAQRVRVVGPWPSSAQFPNSGTHWISKRSQNGDIIVLEDGSMWQIAPLDRIRTALWLPLSKIAVALGQELTYPYLLVNTNTGEVVSARQLQ